MMAVGEEYGFQTPSGVADRMVGLWDSQEHPRRILEPCSGRGTLVTAARRVFADAEIVSVEISEGYCLEQQQAGFQVINGDFFELDPPSRKYDLVIANPPHSPMAMGYKMMDRLVDFSDRMVVIMPWLWLINSQARHEKWREHIRTAIHLPRSTFPGARIQTAIFDIDLLNVYEYTRYI